MKPKSLYGECVALSFAGAFVSLFLGSCLYFNSNWITSVHSSICEDFSFMNGNQVINPDSICLASTQPIQVCFAFRYRDWPDSDRSGHKCTDLSSLIENRPKICPDCFDLVSIFSQNKSLVCWLSPSRNEFCGHAIDNASFNYSTSKGILLGIFPLASALFLAFLFADHKAKNNVKNPSVE